MDHIDKWIYKHNIQKTNFIVHTNQQAKYHIIVSSKLFKHKTTWTKFKLSLNSKYNKLNKKWFFSWCLFPFSEHSSRQIIPKASPFNRHFNKLYIFSTELKRCRVRILRCLKHCRWAHFPGDKVLKQETCRYCSTLDLHQVEWPPTKYCQSTLKHTKCSLNAISGRWALHVEKFTWISKCISSTTPFWKGDNVLPYTMRKIPQHWICNIT